MGAPKDTDSLDAKRQWCIDPNNSVVVTACAGSGKTWLLTSRILRIIIEEPHRPLYRILAITFTNNAAAEIQTQVGKRLREIAYAKKTRDKKAPEKKTQGELLKDIGIEKPPCDPDLKEIYRTFITKRPTISVFTFHSWFTHLIHFLPWAARTSFHSRVADSPANLKRCAWEQMLGSIKEDDSEVAKSMSALLGMHKLRDLQEILVNVIDKRAEWFLYFDCLPEDKNAFQEFQKKIDGGGPSELYTKQKLKEDFQGKLDKLIKGLENEVESRTENSDLRKAHNALSQSRQIGAVGFFNVLQEKIIGKKSISNEVVKKKPGYSLLAAIVEEIKEGIKKVRATEAYLYNLDCARIGTLYAQQYAKVKEQEGVIDYADMELIPLRVIIGHDDDQDDSDSRETKRIQFLRNFFKRLDTYDHILVDEFQDTNPVQWLMLHAWLEENKSVDDPPKVFIVGDPKQSIYSWRGGNPKLLGVARDYLKENYGGGNVSINHTRRCSQKIVDAVNKTFSNEGNWALDSFAAHEVETKEQDDDGSLVLCFQTKGLPPAKEAERKLRNPLNGPAQEEEKGDAKAKIEGEMLADKINKIEKKGYTNKDIMLLHPTGTNSESLINTLAEQGVRCSLLEKSSRMDYLECQDMLALLHAIFDPNYGLMVAQVLRSPVFDVSDDDLWKVYKAGLPEEGKYCNWAKGLDQAENGSNNLQKAQKLLDSWRASYRKEKLPAHELLARCYQEADIIKSYVATVPPGIAKRVVLNLDWILNYSLEAQGGRMVLPSEYAAHLQELSEAGEETYLAAEGDQVIPSLTVHGAKGLESKVVIVANSDYNTSNNWDNLQVIWDLDKRRPSHLSFCRGKEYATDCQKRAQEELAKAREQEMNNLLYVAMTRARQHLFFSKRPSKKKSQSQWWDHVRKSSGNLEEKELDELQPAQTSSSAGKSDIGRREWLGEDPKSIRTGKQNEADNEFKIKGTQRHNLLALILQNENAYSKVMQDNQLLHRRLLGIGEKRLAELHEEIEKVLDPKTKFGKLLADVDKKKNPIECELSAIGKDKKIRRIDCLLTTKDGVVWIIDFKTGGSAFEDKYKDDYDEQLRGYHEVVSSSASYKGRKIKMAIVDKDGGMREVEPA